MMSNPISVNEAKTFVEGHAHVLSPVKLALRHASGLVLSEDVFAVSDIPFFNQSSMDGYAFNFDDWKSGNQIFVGGEISAGQTEKITLGSYQAMRIFTGAAVPPGADTVVMQEKVNIKDNRLIIDDAQLKKGINVRPRGSEIAAGKLALEKGSFLSPAAIGFLAGIGITEVKVYPHPSISIIVTGRELQQPGIPLRYGQVYESNSAGLRAALAQLCLSEIRITKVDDDPALIKTVLTESIEKSDLVLLTGGISAGDYDYVLQACTDCGVEKIFHKVKQRPGKPLYFGKKEKKIIFGLPGNPSSVLTCFYEYVLPVIEKMQKISHSFVQKVHAELTHDYSKFTGLTHFLKGIYAENKVTALDAQESYRMSSFARANCLICMEENRQEWKAGDEVEIHLLPF